jgi:uncharacterized Zn finger protein
MTTTDRTTSTADSRRDDKARFALANSGQWLRIRSKDGRPLAFGVPSTRDPNRVYLVCPNACTCPDAARGHRCKHSIAVAAYVQRRRAEREVRLQPEPYAF